MPFFSQDLTPGQGAFPWDAGWFWLYVLSNAALVLAFYSAPLALAIFARHRSGASSRWLVPVGGTLAVLCGTGYLVEILSYWHPPHPWLAGTVRGLAAATAVLATVLGWLALPKLLARPSSERLIEANREMEAALVRCRQTETELRKLSLAVEHSPSMVLITDRHGRIEYCNPSFCKMSGYASEEMLGQRASLWEPERITPSARRELWSTLNRGEPWEGEILESTKQGAPYWCLEYVAPIRDETGAIAHFIVMSHDISELKDSEETIRRLAYYDPLTKLPNRAMFRERLEQAVEEALRTSGAFALLHLDLDRFNNVNDSLGQDQADQVLVAVSERLRHALREEDVLARLGGDGFAILLPGLRHPVMAGAAATAIGEALRPPFELDGHTLFITASMGISLHPNDHAEAEQLLKMAEAAMRSAKEQGRCQFRLYREVPNRSHGKTLALETGLRYALERGELEVHYQPKFELSSGLCLAAEALIRWRRPGHGLVSPGQFIPLAEETGLIIPIGEWLLRDACRQIGEWRVQGLDLAVAVNLSAQQFRQKNLLERIDAIMEETGVDRSRLEFEITESAAMKDPEGTADTLRRMKNRGLALSIDDFGTGYSSLSYLKMFPLDYLKIDRSFVLDIDGKREDPRLVLAIIALAHSLDLTVIAEGVETRRQLDFLKANHCDIVQGYFFSPPLPPQELLERLRKGAPSFGLAAAMR